MGSDETCVIFKKPVPWLGLLFVLSCHLHAKIKNKSCKQSPVFTPGISAPDEKVNCQIRWGRDWFFCTLITKANLLPPPPFPLFYPTREECKEREGRMSFPWVSLDTPPGRLSVIDGGKLPTTSSVLEENEKTAFRTMLLRAAILCPKMSILARILLKRKYF